MLDEARAQLALIQSDGLDVYRHALWVGSLTYIADACVAVGDADLSEQVYRELLSIAERNVMIGHGVACYGSSERYLGTLAAAYGQLELAELHLQRAIDYNRDMGAITWLAHSDFEYARTLGAQGRADEPAAQAALAEASDLAERIGMPALLGRIRGLLPAGPGASRLPDGLSGREAEILRLVAQGRSNREIGRTLHISEHTAANHIRSILRKTGCANRTEAASYAHTRGLTERG
jgi:DNA-binding CsgD family transcriptional regulator